MRQMPMNSDREAATLLQKVYTCGFAIDDVILYLDTHPDDADGIAYFNQCVEMLRQAKQRYCAMCGCTLAYDGAPYDAYFTWTDYPLPWEGGKVCGCMRNA